MCLYCHVHNENVLQVASAAAAKGHGCIPKLGATVEGLLLGMSEGRDKGVSNNTYSV